MANPMQYGISATYFIHNVNCFYKVDNTVKKFFIGDAAEMNMTPESNTDR
jgi:hypothetical protein